MAPSALLNHFEHSHKHRIEELEDHIKKLGKSDESFEFWHLNGYRNLILKLKETIKKTRKSLAISLWNRDCLLYTSPSPRDRQKYRMPSSA